MATDPHGPLTVCQLIQGLAVGGLERVVVDLCRGLDRRRFRPVVCCYDDLGPLAETLAADGIPIILERRRPGKDWQFPLRLARRLRALGVDVLHAHNQTAFFYGVLAAHLGGVRRIVYTEHDRSFPSSLAVRLSDRALALATHRIFAVSAAIRDQFAATEGIPRDRITVACNGVDETRFDPTADPRLKRAAAGLPEAPTAGIVGRLVPEKNHVLAFAALARLSGVRLLVVGGGPLADQLAAEVGRLGIADRVTFLGSRDDVPDLLAAMDCLVLCSKTEGLPLAPIEAMAAGRPVIVTDVGGCRELIAEGAVGYVVPPGDAATLADRMARLLTDEPLRRRMGAAARRHFEAHFSLPRMVATYESAYLGVPSVVFNRRSDSGKARARSVQVRGGG